VDLKVLKTNARLQVALLLLLFFLITAAHLPVNMALYVLVLTFGSTILFDLLYGWLRFKKLRIPYSAMVTGFILTLIIDPSAAWYQILLITAAAMATKHFLRISGRHIFNPAASGLIIGWIIFGLNPSWWGVTLYRGGEMALIGNIGLFIAMAGILYVSAYRMKRYISVLSFLAVSSLLSMLFPTISFMAFVATFFSIGSLFFGGLMVPEPMTSPIKKSRQLFYGTIIAVLNIAFVFMFASSFFGPDFNPPDSSILALLIANALFFKFR
jgi:Na+-translocating ferredoxin:NAD+ oxidoreductase RnfD subunit